MPASRADAATLAVYVHWPFCVSKCPYCDFNSHVAETYEEARFVDAYRAEIAYFGRLAPGRAAASVFFGGGTPSLMTPGTVASVLDAIDKAWGLAAGAEITLEANPSSVEAGRFEGYRAAGVNRLSLGVQALDDADLRRLGRAHGAAEALAALDLALRIFPRVSFDLIYGRPGQSVESWEAELRRALAFGAEHLSLYQLTIERGTPFFAEVRRGALRLPDDETLTEMYDLTRALAAAAGLPAYEISNHARSGAECRHNQVYWRYGDYAGIGPGAHGRIAGRAFRQIRAPLPWLEAALRRGHGTEEEEPLDPAARGREMLLMGLRLTEGIGEARFQAVTGESLAGFAGAARLDELLSAGLLERNAGFIRATEKGSRLLDAVLRRLLL